jgi:hypothetical protein
MADLDQVVEFDAVLNHSVGQGAPVNAGIGADLHIVANAHRAQAAQFFPRFGRHRGAKPKPSAPITTPWVHNAAITHHAVLRPR